MLVAPPGIDSRRKFAFSTPFFSLLPSPSASLADVFAEAAAEKTHVHLRGDESGGKDK